MKIRLPLLITLALFLTACGNGDADTQPLATESVFSIQKAEANLLEANEFEEKTELEEGEQKEEEELEKMIESFKRQNNVPNITKEDLEKGFYYWDDPKTKKYATPIDSWVYTPGKKGESGRWIRFDLLKQEKINTQALMCNTTGGNYTKSCNELEQDIQCEYIPKSSCECPEGTLWKKDEGCLGSDDLGEFSIITQQEFEQGYYRGLKKKQGTPTKWIFDAKNNLWHSPFYILDNPK